MRSDFETGDGITDAVAVLFCSIPRIDWFKQSIVKAIAEMGDEGSWVQYGTATPEWAQNEANKTLGSIRILIGNPLPLGKIEMLACEDLPEGWLDCDGSVHNRVDFPALWDVIAEALKIDADTFFVPDLNSGRIPIGVPVEGTGVEGGGEQINLVVDYLPAHSHEISIIDPGHLHQDLGDVTTGAGLVGELPAPVSYQTGGYTLPAMTNITAIASNTGGNEPISVPLPPVTGVRFAMYAGG